MNKIDIANLASAEAHREDSYVSNCPLGLRGDRSCKIKVPNRCLIYTTKGDHRKCLINPSDQNKTKGVFEIGDKK